MIERVSGGKPFGLSSGNEGVIAADESERMSGQKIITQSHSQLHGIVSFEGMTLGQSCGCFQIDRCERKASIAMDTLSKKVSVLSVTL